MMVMAGEESFKHQANEIRATQKIAKARLKKIYLNEASRIAIFAHIENDSNRDHMKMVTGSPSPSEQYV